MDGLQIKFVKKTGLVGSRFLLFVKNPVFNKIASNVTEFVLTNLTHREAGHSV